MYEEEQRGYEKLSADGMDSKQTLREIDAPRTGWCVACAPAGVVERDGLLDGMACVCLLPPPDRSSARGQRSQRSLSGRGARGVTPMVRARVLDEALEEGAFMCTQTWMKYRARHASRQDPAGTARGAGQPPGVAA